MVLLFLCRTKQAQIRAAALSNRFTRYYFQIHESPSSVIRQTQIGVVNAHSFTFQRTGSDFRNSVRFFAAPVQVYLHHSLLYVYRLLHCYHNLPNFKYTPIPLRFIFVKYLFLLVDSEICIKWFLGQAQVWRKL